MKKFLLKLTLMCSAQLIWNNGVFASEINEIKESAKTNMLTNNLDSQNSGDELDKKMCNFFKEVEGFFPHSNDVYKIVQKKIYVQLNKDLGATKSYLSKANNVDESLRCKVILGYENIGQGLLSIYKKHVPKRDNTYFEIRQLYETITQLGITPWTLWTNYNLVRGAVKIDRNKMRDGHKRNLERVKIAIDLKRYPLISKISQYFNLFPSEDLNQNDVERVCETWTYLYMMSTIANKNIDSDGSFCLRYIVQPTGSFFNDPEIFLFPNAESSIESISNALAQIPAISPDKLKLFAVDALLGFSRSASLVYKNTSTNDFVDTIKKVVSMKSLWANKRNSLELMKKCIEIINFSRNYFSSRHKELGNDFIDFSIYLLEKADYNCDKAKEILALADDNLYPNRYHLYKNISELKKQIDTFPFPWDEKSLKDAYRLIVIDFAKRVCVEKSVISAKAYKDNVPLPGDIQNMLNEIPNMEKFNDILDIYAKIKISPRQFKNDLYLELFIDRERIEELAKDEIRQSIRIQIRKEIKAKIIEQITSDVKNDPNFTINPPTANEQVENSHKKKKKKKSPAELEIDRRINKYLEDHSAEIDAQTDKQIKDENLFGSQEYVKEIVCKTLSCFGFLYSTFADQETVKTHLLFLLYRDKWVYLSGSTCGFIKSTVENINKTKEIIAESFKYRDAKKVSNFLQTLFSNQLLKYQIQPSFAKDVFDMIQRIQWISSTPLDEPIGEHKIHDEDFYALVDYASMLGKWNTWSALLNCLCKCFKNAHEEFDKIQSEFKKAQEEFRLCAQKFNKDEKKLKEIQEKFKGAQEKIDRDEKTLRKAAEKIGINNNSFIKYAGLKTRYAGSKLLAAFEIYKKDYEEYLIKTGKDKEFEPFVDECIAYIK